MRNTMPLPSQTSELFFDHAEIARCAALDTPAGPLLLYDYCSPTLIEGLRADNGLRAFARRPEREHQLLLDIAKRPENKLTIACTSDGDIIGEVTLAPADARWGNTKRIYEVAIQVSDGWRRWGIAHSLLAFAFEFATLEQMIIVGMGLDWHWDMEGLGLSAYQYREMMARLFAAHDFSEYLTTEPNIRMSPANIFVVRIGKGVDRGILNTFFERLLQSDTLPGL